MRNRTLDRKTPACTLSVAREGRASSQLEACALPSLARLSQTTVQVLGSFPKLLHLTKSERAERLPSLCRLRSFLNFAGDRRLELRARVRAAVCSDTLTRQAMDRSIQVLKVIPFERSYIVLSSLSEFKPNHKSQKSDKHKMLHVSEIHVVTITKKEAAN